jgi:HSP20 family molecular chaperone IbpA
MTKITVHAADSGKAAVTNPFLAKVEKALDTVRRRAFELFEKRGRGPGKELEDWLQAEQELFFVPQAEVTEDEHAFTMKIKTPGFEAAEIEVIALPHEILVEAKAEKREKTGVDARCLYRRFELGAPGLGAVIDTRKVNATLEKGQLVIRAPKEVKNRVPVRAAAA